MDSERCCEGRKRHESDRDQERSDGQVMGVDRGDNDEAHDVVDDGQREDEAAQSFGSVPAQ